MDMTYLWIKIWILGCCEISVSHCMVQTGIVFNSVIVVKKLCVDEEYLLFERYLTSAGFDL